MSEPHISLDIHYHVTLPSTDEQRFHQAAQWVADLCAISRFSASISIVDEETIHALNRDHLGHDWPTDVISFVIEQSDVHVDGEIIASADMASKLCQEAGWPQADEILLYVLHGMLHVAGFDDIEDAERQEMRRQEQAGMLALGVAAAKHHLSRWDDISY